MYLEPLSPMDFVDWSQPINWNNPLNTSLVSYWKVTPGIMGYGSPTWRDAAHRYNGTLQSGTVWSPSSIWGESIGSMNCTTGNGVATSMPVSPPFTILFTSVVPSGLNATCFSAAVNQYEALFAVGTAAVIGRLGFGPTATAGTDWSQAPTTQTVGTIHRYAIGYDGTTAYWWVDGIRTGTTIPPNPRTAVTTGLRIGARANDTLPLTTKLDDFIYCKSVLSNGAVLEDYDNSKRIFNSRLNYILPQEVMQQVAAGAFNAAWLSQRSRIIGGGCR